MSDDEIKVDEVTSPSGFDTMIGGVITSFPLKIMIFLMVFVIFLMSDVFVDKILPLFGKNTTEAGNTPTTWGAFITSLILVIFYAAVDLIVKKEWI